VITTVMVFNATFSNISVILLRSVLLVEVINVQKVYSNEVYLDTTFLSVDTEQCIVQCI
jgi:hypothetical protein